MFFVGVLDEKKLTIIVKCRHIAYAQLPPSLDDKHTYSPILVIIITVISDFVHAWLGLIIPMFALVTIITYGLKTLIYFKLVLNIYMFILYCIGLMILNHDPMLIKVLI